MLFDPIISELADHVLDIYQSEINETIRTQPEQIDFVWLNNHTEILLFNIKMYISKNVTNFAQNPALNQYDSVLVSYFQKLRIATSSFDWTLQMVENKIMHIVYFKLLERVGLFDAALSHLAEGGVDTMLIFIMHVWGYFKKHPATDENTKLILTCLDTLFVLDIKITMSAFFNQKVTSFPEIPHTVKNLILRTDFISTPKALYSATENVINLSELMFMTPELIRFMLITECYRHIKPYVRNARSVLDYIVNHKQDFIGHEAFLNLLVPFYTKDTDELAKHLYALTESEVGRALWRHLHYAFFDCLGGLKAPALINWPELKNIVVAQAINIGYQRIASTNTLKFSELVALTEWIALFLKQDFGNEIFCFLAIKLECHFANQVSNHLKTLTETLKVNVLYAYAIKVLQTYPNFEATYKRIENEIIDHLAILYRERICLSIASQDRVSTRKIFDELVKSQSADMILEKMYQRKPAYIRLLESDQKAILIQKYPNLITNLINIVSSVPTNNNLPVKPKPQQAKTAATVKMSPSATKAVKTTPSANASQPAVAPGEQNKSIIKDATIYKKFNRFAADLNVVTQVEISSSSNGISDQDKINITFTADKPLIDALVNNINKFDDTIEIAKSQQAMQHTLKMSLSRLDVHRLLGSDFANIKLSADNTSSSVSTPINALTEKGLQSWITGIRAAVAGETSLVVAWQPPAEKIPGHFLVDFKSLNPQWVVSSNPNQTSVSTSMDNAYANKIILVIIKQIKKHNDIKSNEATIQSVEGEDKQLRIIPLKGHDALAYPEGLHQFTFQRLSSDQKLLKSSQVKHKSGNNQTNHSADTKKLSNQSNKDSDLQHKNNDKKPELPTNVNPYPQIIALFAHITKHHFPGVKFGNVIHFSDENPKKRLITFTFNTKATACLANVEDEKIDTQIVIGKIKDAITEFYNPGYKADSTNPPARKVIDIFAVFNKQQEYKIVFYSNQISLDQLIESQNDIQATYDQMNFRYKETKEELAFKEKLEKMLKKAEREYDAQFLQAFKNLKIHPNQLQCFRGLLSELNAVIIAQKEQKDCTDPDEKLALRLEHQFFCYRLFHVLARIMEINHRKQMTVILRVLRNAWRHAENEFNQDQVRVTHAFILALQSITNENQRQTGLFGENLYEFLITPEIINETRNYMQNFALQNLNYELGVETVDDRINEHADIDALMDKIAKSNLPESVKKRRLVICSSYKGHDVYGRDCAVYGETGAHSDAFEQPDEMIARVYHEHFEKELEKRHVGPRL